jgi:hypothetical protein
MDVSRRIILYGNSLILGTLETSLRSCSQFEVTTLSPPLPGTRELETFKPDVILFDVNSTHTEAVFPLLESCPNLLLIGVSPDKNRVQMWAGQQLKELSTQGLMNVINQQLKDSKVT